MTLARSCPACAGRSCEVISGALARRNGEYALLMPTWVSVSGVAIDPLPDEVGDAVVAAYSSIMCR